MPPAPMVSYAQNAEDVVLARVLTAGSGFYIDVGAAHPVSHSVTKHFYDRGWCGVNLEPLPGFFAALTAARPRDVNLNAAASDAPGGLTLFEPTDSSGEATLDAAVADAARAAGRTLVAREVRAVTLAQVCEQYARGAGIDFLKVDAEGHEAAVLRGMDFDRWRPRLVLVEATAPGSPTPTHGEWEDGLLSRGYLLALFDGLNRFYVRVEDRDLLPALSAPANVFDRYIRAEQADAEARAARLEAEAAVIPGLREQLSAARGETTEAREELTVVRAALTSAYGERDAARHEAAAAKDIADAAQATAEQARADAETARRETDEAHREAAAARDLADAARRDAEAARAAAEQATSAMLDEREAAKSARLDAIEAKKVADASRHEMIVAQRAVVRARQAIDHARRDAAAAWADARAAADERDRLAATSVPKTAYQSALALQRLTREHMEALRHELLVGPTG